MARKLTKKQQGFAQTYVDTGNATLAVKENYEVSSDNSAAVLGSNLLRNNKVLEYIEDKAEVAASIVFQIAQFGESDPVRLSASKDILDRAGYKPIERSIQVTHTIDESTQRTEELADRLGRLLGR